MKTYAEILNTHPDAKKLYPRAAAAFEQMEKFRPTQKARMHSRKRQSAGTARMHLAGLETVMIECVAMMDEHCAPDLIMASFIAACAEASMTILKATAGPEHLNQNILIAGQHFIACLLSMSGQPSAQSAVIEIKEGQA